MKLKSISALLPHGIDDSDNGDSYLMFMFAKSVLHISNDIKPISSLKNYNYDDDNNNEHSHIYSLLASALKACESNDSRLRLIGQNIVSHADFPAMIHSLSTMKAKIVQLEYENE